MRPDGKSEIGTVTRTENRLNRANRVFVCMLRWSHKCVLVHVEVVSQVCVFVYVHVEVVSQVCVFVRVGDFTSVCV